MAGKWRRAKSTHRLLPEFERSLVAVLRDGIGLGDGLDEFRVDFFGLIQLLGDTPEIYRNGDVSAALAPREDVQLAGDFGQRSVSTPRQTRSAFHGIGIAAKGFKIHFDLLWKPGPQVRVGARNRSLKTAFPVLLFSVPFSFS
jgi:hypothetical protein